MPWIAATYNNTNGKEIRIHINLDLVASVTEASLTNDARIAWNNSTRPPMLLNETYEHFVERLVELTQHP